MAAIESHQNESGVSIENGSEDIERSGIALAA